MARPLEPGLHYYTKQVNFYDEENYLIKDLSDEYGPIGLTVYEVLCCLVYKNGYYIEIKNLDWLAKVIRSKIGSRWIKSPKLVLQVIYYCADIGLIHKDLLRKNIITSVQIQQAYQRIAARKKISKEKYWLLDGDWQPLLSAPQNIVSATETDINVAETDINVTEMQQEKRREYIKYYSDEGLNELFLSYIESRAEKENITIQQIELLKRRLDELGDTEEDKKKIIEQSIAGNYKSFFPVSKKQKRHTVSKNAFHNFEEREYDFDTLEKAFQEKLFKTFESNC